jgi:integrating conjugative element membrane protein (TIGR03747 family)
MSANKEEKKNSSSPRTPDKSLMGKLIFVLLVAWVIAMVVNMIDWNKQGYTFLIKTLDEAYAKYREELFTRNETLNIYSDAVILLIKEYTQPFFIAVMQKSQTLTSSSNLFDFKSDKSAKKFISIIYQNAIQFLSVVIATTKILFAKVMNIIVSFWLYVFASLLGALDGLVKRYIRTAEGGRESTFVFHKVSHVVIQLPIWILALYLIIPDTFSPEIVVMLISLALFAFFTIATSQLKKYL